MSELTVESVRTALKLLREAEPMPMQWITWVDETGVHSKFYGHRARLAAKKRKGREKV